ncbi:MAG: CotH kinase family protein [Alkalispirochaeta sp.]
MCTPRLDRGLGLIPAVIVILVVLVGCTDEQSADDEGPDGVVEISFDEYRGSQATLPEGISVSGEDGDGVPVGGDYYPFTGVSTHSREDEFVGFGAFTADEEDYSFGIRERGSSDLRDSRVFLEYENTTDRKVYGLRVSYDVETWFIGERDNRIRLKYHTDTTGFGSIDEIVSTTNPGNVEEDDPRQGQAVDGSLEENRTTVEVAFHFSRLRGMAESGLDRFRPLDGGEKGYLRWQYSNDRLTEGAQRSALALNNLRVEPVFTPAPSGEGDGRDEESSSGDAGSGSDASPEDVPLGAVAFSRPPGIHDEPFDLEIHSTLPGVRIYYTVDGSEPDPEGIMTDEEWREAPRETRRRTFEYRDPIALEELIRQENDITMIPTAAREDNLGWEPPESEVPKGAVVRAIALGDVTRSAMKSGTFFVRDEESDHDALPIWSIQTDRGNFFDPDSGIYVPGTDLPEVNYFRRGSDWEREAHVEFFEEDGRRVLAQQMGVRIHGNYTRTFAQKTLRLYSRTDYGPGRMRHRFFPSRDLDDYNRMLLRNGGNDWMGGMLTDPTLQTLVQHLPIDTQHYRPSVVYLNGEYWGLHNMRDRPDQHYLETRYGVPRDEVVIVLIEGVVDTGQWDEEGELYQPYIEFRDRVSSGEIAGWDELNEEMALSEYIDYLFAQVYAGNYDWPQNNIRYWRYTGPDRTEEEGPRDGRWRWILYDVDFAFGHQLATTFDMVEWTFGYTEDHPFLQEGRREDEQDRFELNHRLVDTEDVRHELLQRFAVHLATTAREERALALVDRLARRIEGEMPRQIARWGRPESMDEWAESVDRMRDSARRRPTIVRDDLVQFFDDATGVAELTIRGLTGDGGVSLHTVDLAEDTPGVEIRDGQWSGLLLTGIPVTLESTNTDLREASFDDENRVEVTERSRDRLSFYLTEATALALPSPRE